MATAKSRLQSCSDIDSGIANASNNDGTASTFVYTNVIPNNLTAPKPNYCQLALLYLNNVMYEKPVLLRSSKTQHSCLCCHEQLLFKSAEKRVEGACNIFRHVGYKKCRQSELKSGTPLVFAEFNRPLGGHSSGICSSKCCAIR